MGRIRGALSHFLPLDTKLPSELIPSSHSRDWDSDLFYLNPFFGKNLLETFSPECGKNFQKSPFKALKKRKAKNNGPPRLRT